MRKDCIMQGLLKFENHLIGGCNVLVGGGGNRRNPGKIGYWADLDAAKQLGSEAAKQVTGKMYCYVLLSEGEKVAVRAERVTDTREGLAKILHSVHPSPTFVTLAIRS